MEQSVKLVAITEGAGDLLKRSAEDVVAYAARVSNPSNQENFTTAPRLIRYLIDQKHWSPFEMVSITLEISTSRGISPQILRHRSFSFQEFSQRYAAVDNSGVVIYAARRQDQKNRQNSIDDLSEAVKREWEERQLQNWKTSFEHYKWALDNNIAKECARFVLPLGCKTKLYMAGTLRSWIHYCDLRASNGTQKEHADIAIDARSIIAERFPDVALALGWTGEKYGN